MLLQLAGEAIDFGIEHATALTVSAQNYPEALRERRASFVTLHRHHQLRGCIGSLEARRPLVDDVADNAYAAAFRDPRFPALTRAERDALSIHISVLHVAERLRFNSERALVEQLRPGSDGLILQDGAHRATFLPSVWESLTEAQEFVNALKKKAGLRGDYWSDTMQAWRYATESFP